MDYTQMLGNSNELRCITSFILLGFECSIPYGNGAKYDFIADDGEFLRYFYCANEIREWFLLNENKDIKTGTSHINSCCSGNVSQAYGYIWKYEDRIPINEITI